MSAVSFLDSQGSFLEVGTLGESVYSCRGVKILWFVHIRVIIASYALNSLKQDFLTCFLSSGARSMLHVAIMIILV